MFFSTALLHATYKNGQPGKLTEAHAKAEHHRFKKDFLFKDVVISKELYASRLIQHFLIIKAIESQLKNVADDAKKELSPFFSLVYLEHLWRTSPMANDLRLLDVTPDLITKPQIAPATAHYVEQIHDLKPKQLLAHFLLHVFGFMHGGSIIKTKYIQPSNHLSPYTIPSQQYDFSSAISQISEHDSVMSLYSNLKEEIDKISLDASEYAQILGECNTLYETMASIYDDLCAMHIKQSTLPILALFAIALTAIVLNRDNLKNYFNLSTFNFSLA